MNFPPQSIIRECALKSVAIELMHRAVVSSETTVKQQLNLRSDAYLAAASLPERGAEIVFKLLRMQPQPSTCLIHALRRLAT